VWLAGDSIFVESRYYGHTISETAWGIDMKKLLLAIGLVTAFTGSAFAADLPAQTYSKAPAVVAPAYNWTGFYIFGGAGGGLWSADTYTLNPATGNCALCAHMNQGGSGYFGTVGAGYDWQFNRSWVAGLFADGQFGSLRGTIQDQGPFFSGNEKLRDTWAVGVRLGYLVAPNVLSYVNAGYTGSDWSGTTMILSQTLSTTPFVTPSFSRSGWFVGGGVENNFDIFGISAPGWFMKTEYRMAYFDAIDLTDSVPGAGAVVAIPGVGGGFANPQSSIHFKPDVQTISTSLVYRFNWGSSVVAKY
jgi:outer membrane immunogenic protein